MTRYLCEQVIAPGVVVFLAHDVDLTRSTWGVTIPFDYWCRFSKTDVIARFEGFSCGSDSRQIPYLEFTNGEEWKFRFGMFPSTVKSFCWLEDFASTDRKSVPETMRVCSMRDGGRYYRVLFSELSILARGASREFTRDELRKESAGVQRLIAHCKAIRAWKLENPNWKNAYNPGHRLHVSLF